MKRNKNRATIRILGGAALLLLGVRLLAIPPEWCDYTYSWCGDALNGPIELSNPYGDSLSDDTLEIHLLGWSTDASKFCSTTVIVPPKGVREITASVMGFKQSDKPFSIQAYTTSTADTFGCNINPHGGNGDMPPRPHGGPEAIGCGFQSGTDHVFIHNPTTDVCTVLIWTYHPVGTLMVSQKGTRPDTEIIKSNYTIDYRTHANPGSGYTDPSYIIQSKDTTDSIVVTIGVGIGSYMPFGLDLLKSEYWTITMDNKSEQHMFNPSSTDTVIFQMEYWYWAGDSTAGRRHPSPGTTVFYQDTILPLHHIVWCPDDFGATDYNTWVIVHVTTGDTAQKFAIVDHMTIETSDALVPPTDTYYRFWWAISDGAHGEVAIANCANDSTPVICRGWDSEGREYSIDTTWLAPYEYRIQLARLWVGWVDDKVNHSMQAWAGDWGGMVVWGISPQKGRLIPQLYGSQTPGPVGLEEFYEPFKPDLMFKAYPNPSNGIVKFLFDSFNTKARIDIYDVSGRRVKVFNITENARAFRGKLVNEFGAPLPAGIYFATLNTSDGYFDLSKTVKLTLVR